MVERELPIPEVTTLIDTDLCKQVEGCLVRKLLPKMFSLATEDFDTTKRIVEEDGLTLISDSVVVSTEEGMPLMSFLSICTKRAPDVNHQKFPELAQFYSAIPVEDVCGYILYRLHQKDPNRNL